MTGEKLPGVFAGAGNRAVAFLLDITIVIVIIAMTPPIPEVARIVPAAIFFLYFAALPLTPLQGTIGKRLCGIRLSDRAGRPVSWWRSLVRAAATVGWIWLVSFASAQAALLGGGALIATWTAWLLAWAVATFMPRGESLFDLLAGTLVVRYKADAAAIAQAAPATRPGLVTIGTAIVVCFLAGVFFSTAIQASRDRNLRARVDYAVQKTQPLQAQVGAFHAREKRWPAPSELGVAAFTPYPDGGGYRLQPDGSIVIGFTVTPELKDHTLVLRPTVVANSGSVAWKCTGDKAMRPVYLPGYCRD